jgi:hypothetical protein
MEYVTRRVEHARERYEKNKGNSITIICMKLLKIDEQEARSKNIRAKAAKVNKRPSGFIN